MKRIIALLLTGTLLCVASCTRQREKIPPDSFRLTIEDMASSDVSLIKFLSIESTGKRQIKLSANEQTTTATVDPLPEKNIMSAEITLIALLTQYPKGAILEWAVQIITPETTVGGPTNITTQAGKIQDVLQFEIKPGIYPLGQEMEIGQLQDKPIILLIE